VKIALCYSGDVRGWLGAIDSQLRLFGFTRAEMFYHRHHPLRGASLILPPNAEVDLFGHIWDDIKKPVDVHTLPHLPKFKKITVQPRRDHRFWKEAKQLGFPTGADQGVGNDAGKKFVWFRRQIDHGQARPEEIGGKGNAANSLSMFWGIEHSIKYALEAEGRGGFKYDFIFRIRPDLYIRKGLETPRELSSYDGDKLNISPKRAGSSCWWLDGANGYIDDWFAFGNGAVMKKYCEAYSSMRFLVRGKPPAPEAALWMHIKRMQLDTSSNDWELSLKKIAAAN
jgi:hypothetical protein